jgi:hypothetical protein
MHSGAHQCTWQRKTVWYICLNSMLQRMLKVNKELNWMCFKQSMKTWVWVIYLHIMITETLVSHMKRFTYMNNQNSQHTKTITLICVLIHNYKHFCNDIMVINWQFVLCTTTATIQLQYHSHKQVYRFSSMFTLMLTAFYTTIYQQTDISNSTIFQSIETY